MKYLFLFTSALLLVLMLLISRDAGITCDEVLHYDQSLAVYDYFATHGTDRAALNTPVTYLKYYGQSYDNIVTIFIKWFHISNVYRFRHTMSSLAGWLAIMVTALFAVWLSGYRTGVLVLLLFAVSPSFLGHSQNNLKDIPFALGYISATYFICRFLFSKTKLPLKIISLLTLSIAFSISIRAGGILLICYLFLFFFLFFLYKYFKDKERDFPAIRYKMLLIIVITVVSWFMGILLWPYALQNPVRNVLEANHVMAHFPGTFRQIFEGRMEWSDFMPWYYLLKSMSITIPLLVIAGFALFFIFTARVLRDSGFVYYLFVLFTILFPVAFVIYEKSNLYSSWRQFLFIYPALILIAATGFSFLFEHFGNNKIPGWVTGLLILVMAVHPAKFMAGNHRYSYIYYNQLVGGLHGAFGSYETDYYYVSQTEASEWLTDHLGERKDTGVVKVKATYPADWLFRHYPGIVTSYFRYEERSMSDWDYAIVVNRYIPPFQLKNHIWPPANAIHVIYADCVPICAVLERKSKDDLYGYESLGEGRTGEAIKLFRKALAADSTDEMIYYNYGRALYDAGMHREADSALKRGLTLNPGFEPVLMYLGNIARSEKRKDDAVFYYEKVIRANRKYFEAYVGLAEFLAEKNVTRARELLRTCLEMDPGFKPAVVALADTYRSTNPDIAKKYDELAEKLK